MEKRQVLLGHSHNFKWLRSEEPKGNILGTFARALYCETTRKQAIKP